MKQYIYYLKTKDTLFYVGITSDPMRREKDHHYAKHKGTELKYQAIREFELNNIDWWLEVKAEATEEYDEDFAVYEALLNKHPLTNMKAGDVYKAIDEELLNKQQKFNNAIEFHEARKQAKAKAKAKAKLKPKRKPSNNGVFIDDLQNTIKGKTKPSAGLSGLMKRIKNKKLK